MHKQFRKGEKVDMKVPEGWEGLYSADVVLHLLCTIYGQKPAAMVILKELFGAMRNMGLKSSTADSCLYYAWINLGLVIIFLGSMIT